MDHFASGDGSQHNRTSLGQSPPAAPAAFPAPPSQTAALRVFPQEELDRVIRFYSDQLATGFKHSAGYLQIVLAAGYAGLFGLWKIAEPGLSAWASNMVVLLMGLSLLWYVSYAVYCMIWQTIENRRTRIAVKGKGGDEYVRAIQEAEKETNRRMEKLFWPLWEKQLVLTIAPAAMAFVILFGNVAVELLRV
jgi:hypothetical protein